MGSEMCIRDRVAGGRFGIKSCLIDLDPKNDDFLTPIDVKQIQGKQV